MNFDDGLVIGLALGGGKTGTKTIVKNGEYNSADDGLTGYNKVIVKLPLDEKSITKNGTYYAKDDDLEGYDVINVNVKVKYDSGSGETEIDPGDDVITPEGIKGEEWIWKFSVEYRNPDDPNSPQRVLCTKTAVDNPEDVRESIFYNDANINRSYNIKIISAVKVESGYKVTVEGYDTEGNMYTSSTIFD